MTQDERDVCADSLGLIDAAHRGNNAGASALLDFADLRAVALWLATSVRA